MNEQFERDKICYEQHSESFRHIGIQDGLSGNYARVSQMDDAAARVEARAQPVYDLIEYGDRVPEIN